MHVIILQFEEHKREENKIAPEGLSFLQGMVLVILGYSVQNSGEMLILLLNKVMKQVL